MIGGSAQAPRIRLCPKCHKQAQLISGRLFCEICGARLCPNCNAIVPHDSNYCPDCSFRCGIVPSTSLPSKARDDLKPLYSCPQCGTRVDAPSSKKCTKCGFIGVMQRMDSQQQVAGGKPITADIKQTKASPSLPQSKFLDEVRRPEPKLSHKPPPRSPLLSEIEHGEKRGWGFPSSKEQPIHEIKATDTEPREWNISVPRRFLRPILASQLLLLLVIGGFFLVRNVILPTIGQRGSDTYISTPPTSIITPAPTYTLIRSVTPEGGGQISISPLKETYTSGTQLTLTATASDGYIFDHWGGDATGSSPIIPITINSNTSIIVYFKAKDTTPPVISNVEVTKCSDTNTTINWKTDEPATGQVEYGTTSAYSSNTSPDESLTTIHSVALARLISDTTYYFRVKSKDSSGNEATLSDAKTFRTLTTIPVGSEIGNRAPDFTLPYWKDPNPRDPQTPNKGGEVVLSNLLGKKVLLNLWSTYCGPCVNELPLIREIYQERGKNSGDLFVITICLDREETNRIKELEEKYLEKGLLCTFPILLDKEYKTATDYNIRSYPMTFLINSGGIIEKIKDECFQDKAGIESFINSP